MYTNHNRKGTFLQRVQREESLLAPSFEHVTFRPRFFSNLQPYLPYRIQPHGRAPFKWPVLWGPLCSSRQQAVRNTVQTFPQPVSLERVCRTSAWLTCSRKGARLWFFVSSTWSFQAVSHPSTIQAECCLTSVFKWELVFPTWHGPLTRKDLCS